MRRWISFDQIFEEEMKRYLTEPKKILDMGGSFTRDELEQINYFKAYYRPVGSPRYYPIIISIEEIRWFNREGSDLDDYNIGVSPAIIELDFGNRPVVNGTYIVFFEPGETVRRAVGIITLYDYGSALSIIHDRIREYGSIQDYYEWLAPYEFRWFGK